MNAEQMRESAAQVAANVFQHELDKQISSGEDAMRGVAI